MEFWASVFSAGYVTYHLSKLRMVRERMMPMVKDSFSYSQKWNSLLTQLVLHHTKTVRNRVKSWDIMQHPHTISDNKPRLSKKRVTKGMRMGAFPPTGT